MSGGDKTASGQITQNRNQIQQTGGRLDQNAQGASDAYGLLAQQRRAQSDQAYAPALNGGGGYNAQQEADIRDQAGLQGLRTGEPDLQSNYLTDQEQGGIRGDQSGIRGALGDVRGAIDPASVQSFTDRTRLTQQQQDAMATSAARDQSLEGRSVMANNVERAQGAGLDPLGVASYAGRANQQSQINAANAAAAARVQANEIAAQWEQGILGANQQLSGQRARAASEELGSETGMENAASQRNAGIAANRQGVNQSNQATRFNQGQYIEGQGAARAAGVADTQLAAQQKARDYLTDQGSQMTGAQLAEQGIQSGVYGTETGGLNESTNTQVKADQKPAWWQSLLSAGSQVAAGSKYV